MMNELILPLKKRWFDMIASGEKKEEYREITEYWKKRFVKAILDGQCSKVTFTLGYPKREDTSRRMTFNNPKLRIGTGRPEWGAVEGKKYFVITWKK